MNNNVYDSKYMFVEVDTQHRLIYHYWKANSKYMDDAIYKEEILHLVPIIAQFKPTKYLLNSAQFVFTISPETQAWTNKNIIAVNFAAGITYSAMVVPQDFFALVSVEQTMDDFEKKDFKNRFFTDENEAKQWLMSLT